MPTEEKYKKLKSQRKKNYLQKKLYLKKCQIIQDYYTILHIFEFDIIYILIFQWIQTLNVYKKLHTNPRAFKLHNIAQIKVLFFQLILFILSDRLVIYHQSIFFKYLQYFNTGCWLYNLSNLSNFFSIKVFNVTYFITRIAFL